MIRFTLWSIYVDLDLGYLEEDQNWVWSSEPEPKLGLKKKRTGPGFCFFGNWNGNHLLFRTGTGGWRKSKKLPLPTCTHRSILPYSTYFTLVCMIAPIGDRSSNRWKCGHLGDEMGREKCSMVRRLRWSRERQRLVYWAFSLSSVNLRPRQYHNQRTKKL